MCQGRLDIKKNLFSETGVKRWHRLPREVVKSQSLEMFMNHGEMALRDMVSGHGGGVVAVELNDLRGLFLS